MNKKIMVCVAVGILCAALGFGQAPDKPYAYTFEKGVGTCVLTGVSLDDAWSAAVKALMGNKFKIVSSEKQSGSMTAERRPFGTWNYGLTLYFEQKGPDVSITASLYKLPGQQQEGIGGLLQGVGAKKAEQKEERKFFDRTAEILYKMKLK